MFWLCLTRPDSIYYGRLRGR